MLKKCTWQNTKVDLCCSVLLILVQVVHRRGLDLCRVDDYVGFNGQVIWQGKRRDIYRITTSAWSPPWNASSEEMRVGSGFLYGRREKCVVRASEGEDGNKTHERKLKTSKGKRKEHRSAAACGKGLESGGLHVSTFSSLCALEKNDRKSFSSGSEIIKK